MPTFAAYHRAAVAHYLAQNNLTSLGAINGNILEEITHRCYEAFHEQEKARKKRGEATPEECAIYDAYPRKEGKLDALKAIREACQTTAPSVILEASRRYGLCVERWPASYRYKDNRDLCPMPGTWFRGGRYLDDQKHWIPAGMFTQEQDRKPTSHNGVGELPIPEPQGWREAFPDFIHKDKPWGQLDHTTQQHITSQMNQP